MSLRLISRTLLSFRRCHLRQYSATSIQESIQDALDDSQTSNVATSSQTGSKRTVNPDHRDHTQIKVPLTVIKAMLRILSDENLTELSKAAGLLRRQLWSRHLPAEELNLRNRAQQLENELLGPNTVSMDEDLAEKIRPEVEKLVLNKLRRETYLWKAMNYDHFGSLAYLVGRSAQDYATIKKIFGEIQYLDKSFQPKTFFDFGSGVGTVFWAARESWPRTMEEYFSVDISSDMNELSRLILQGGDREEPLKFKRFYQRTRLPASSVIKYDVTVSAFSLFELPNMKARLTAVANLWDKTNGKLVIVENGTKSGHEVVQEARDFVLSLNEATVLAPCPHQGTCQRTSHPCSFPVRFESSLPQPRHPVSLEGAYSYVVLQRTPNSNPVPEVASHPRIVEPVLCKSRHVICRACCKDGVIREQIYTKSKHHASGIYRIARTSRWGDSLPFELDFPVE